MLLLYANSLYVKISRTAEGLGLLFSRAGITHKCKCLFPPSLQGILKN